MSNKHRIMIIQPVLTDYRKEIFDIMSTETDLTVLYGRGKSGVNRVVADYAREINGISIFRNEGSWFHFAFNDIRKGSPRIFIHYFSPGVISLPLVLLYCRLRGVKFVLWGHGVDRIKGFHPYRSLSGFIRLVYARMADAVILYGHDAKGILGRYIRPEKIFVAPNTLNTEKLLQLRNGFEKTGMEKIREELNIRHKYNILYIGRLYREKGLEDFIRVISALEKVFRNDIGGIIIGDGPERKHVESLISDNNLQSNVHMTGSIYDDTLSGKYLFVSDVMLMPGCLGLSVIHALSYHCPVVSGKPGPDGPFHPPEAENVIDNRTGYFAENAEDMANWIREYLVNETLKIRVKESIDKQLEIVSPENMLNGFYLCFNYLLLHDARKKQDGMI
ncbi:MAG TPA: glycosyltransferase [Bacteroidales bacterium]|nr:glycosyltransferase [Bacteroidales bacterium]